MHFTDEEKATRAEMAHPRSGLGNQGLRSALLHPTLTHTEAQYNYHFYTKVPIYRVCLEERPDQREVKQLAPDGMFCYVTAHSTVPP